MTTERLRHGELRARLQSARSVHTVTQMVRFLLFSAFQCIERFFSAFSLYFSKILTVNQYFDILEH